MYVSLAGPNAISTLVINLDDGDQQVWGDTFTKHDTVLADLTHLVKL